MGTRTRGSRSSRDSRKHRGVGRWVQNEFLDGRRTPGRRSAYGAWPRRRAAGPGVPAGLAVSYYAGWVMEMSRADFEVLVSEALDEVPPELAALLDNVAIFVEDEPPASDPQLLGIYEGIPLTE